MLTCHSLGRLGSIRIPEKEATTCLQKVGDILDVELEVVEEDLQYVKNRVWPSHFELGEFTIESSVLETHAIKLTDCPLTLQVAHFLVKLESVMQSAKLYLTLLSTATPTSGMYGSRIAMKRA